MIKKIKDQVTDLETHLSANTRHGCRGEGSDFVTLKYISRLVIAIADDLIEKNEVEKAKREEDENGYF